MHHTAVEASQKSRGPVMNVKSRSRAREKCKSRSRAREKCKSRSRICTSRGGHIPYKYQVVPNSPGVTESRGISSRSRENVFATAVLSLSTA